MTASSNEVEPRRHWDGEASAALGNSLLIGVPTAYLMTGSVLVTGFAATAGTIVGCVRLLRKR